jgi:hypothetical protein
VAAAALSAAAIPAASAAQAQDTVTINSVTSSVSPGQIYVSVTSTTALTTLNVNVMSGSTVALALTISDFTLETGGTNTDGTYELTTNHTMAQLPDYGTYTLDVSAADSGGGTASNDSTSLDWLLQSTVTISASETTFTYNSPSITFSGALSLFNPDGTAASSTLLSGQTLDLTGGPAEQPVVTGTGGAYSITVSQPSDQTYYSVIVNATTTQTSAMSPQIYVQAQQDPAIVTASVSATQLNYGQTLTITGTATYNPGSGYVPLANSSVQLYGGPYYDSTAPFMTATTNAAGQYTFSFKDDGTDEWYVYAGGVPGDSFLDLLLSQALAITKSVNVAIPVRITALRGSLSPFAVLTLTGCLGAGGSAFPPALSLQAQYATKTSGPWHTLRTVHGLSGTSCGSGSTLGQTFKYQVPVVLASAYYRLSYAGSADYEPAASGVLHEAKIVTRITNFDISSHSISRDGHVTVSGRLWKYVKGWHPLARQRVWILFHYKGEWIYYPDKPLTSSSGRFSGRFPAAYGTAPWIAEYMGSKAYFASASKEVTVKVTSASSAGSIPALGAAPLPR